MNANRLVPLLLIVFMVDPAPAQPFDPILESSMYKSPNLPTPRTIQNFPEGAKELWLQALARPEADLRCQAAAAIARAHRQGVKGFETTIGPLQMELERPEQHPAARLAVAEALIALDARTTAATLFQQAQAGDADLRELIEPALAKWDFVPARAVWLTRLHDAVATLHQQQEFRTSRLLILAIQCLGATRDVKAAEPLRTLALAEAVSGPVCLEASRALAALRDSGLEKDAERLMGDATARGLVGRLIAVELLRRHQGADAVRLLQKLADDADAAVACRAAEQLLAIDPALLIPEIARRLTHADPKMRLLAVEAVLLRPTATLVPLLGNRLDDPHGDVRVRARRALQQLALQGQLSQPVIASATRMLATPHWRGLEQAAILLTQLDHKPAAPRLVELLGHDRPETALTAAWSLRRLAVLETLPAALRFVEARMTKFPPVTLHPTPGRLSLYLVDYQVSQLNQFFGQQKYLPAEKVLRRFVPKQADPPIPESRAAAIWSLGLMLEGKTDAALGKALQARLDDIGSIPPEDDRVRFASAITLGRLRDQQAAPMLRKHYPDGEPTLSLVNNACGWALERITGEPMPPPKTLHLVQRDWFLVPNRVK